ncbi:Cadherin domain protein [Roseimaritima multifibrata]|uniref:Cadherin domain protein n=1 Tax=Roseimaritima multifibrata TaxID=1930274 RepID=A0A517MDR2_9BACT|nr:cadherin domain-containing protein [Roseimaritima multifibrata]QDS92976.1 Cadherin domain protein [Roseimaritima multifibrata]
MPGKIKRPLDFYPLEDRVLLSGEGAPDGAAAVEIDPDLVASLMADGEAPPDQPVQNLLESSETSLATDLAEPDGEPADSSGTDRPIEIIFVDAAVEDSATLVENLRGDRGAQTQWIIVELNPYTDGVEQISQTLASLSGVDAIHLLSHGDGKGLQLGSTLLNQQSLEAHAGEITNWRDAFDSGGDILIYGCDLASSAEGQDLIESLAVLTETDIAASDDVTGHEERGGDWNLEFETGAIETEVAFSMDARSQWHGVLDNTGWKTASGFSDDYQDWNNPDETSSSDNTYASGNFANANQDWQNFDFDIPLNHDIQGILVSLEGSRTGAAPVNTQIALSWDGGASYTAVKNLSWNNDSDATQSVGSSGDLWGHAWDDAEFANENFRILVRSVDTAAGNQFRLDHLQIQIEHSEPANQITVTTTADYSDLNANYGDTSSFAALRADMGDDGLISLREAMDAAENQLGADIIQFSIANTDLNYSAIDNTYTIQLNETLPFMNEALTLDATTQSGYDGTPSIVLDGSHILGADNNGLVADGGDITIRGFALQGFSGTAIHFADGDNYIIESNFIGTTGDGLTEAGNATGIYFGGGVSDSIIGGRSPESGNVISGNSEYGILVDQATTNLIQGNTIGLGADGSTLVGSQGIGIALVGASGIQIGSDADGLYDATEGNVISGNQTGIQIRLASSINNSIRGNFIGTDATGLLDRGNAVDGILIQEEASTTTIGGELVDANTIAFNGGAGIVVTGNNTERNTIRRNSIFLNDGLGIDLASDTERGFNSNDLGDIDAGGNSLQNHPILESISIDDAGDFSYSLDTSTFKSGAHSIDFYASDELEGGQVEGSRYLGTIINIQAEGTSVTGTLNGISLSPGALVTALATDSTGNTSEFSQYTVATDSDAGGSALTGISIAETVDGGLRFNKGGGDDTYLIADDGNAILGGRDRLTFEIQFATTDTTNLLPLVSYATSSNSDEFALSITSTGHANIEIAGSQLEVLNFNYDSFADGTLQTLAFTWNSSTGDWQIIHEGLVVSSGTNLATGQSLGTGGTLIFGQDQESVEGGFTPSTSFTGTLFNARFFDELRSTEDLVASQRKSLPDDEAGMLAQWDFNQLERGGILLESVAGNNLTLRHASQPGFTADIPELTLRAIEESADGSVIGTLRADDIEREAKIANLLATDSDLRFNRELNQFYKLILTEDTLATATANANSMFLESVAGQLASITTATEQAYLYELAEEGTTSVWLGGSDSVVEGEWRWFDTPAENFWVGDGTGSSPTGQYTNFAQNEPNDSGGNSDYLILDQNSGQWFDKVGGELFHSIVQWDADAVLETNHPLSYSLVHQTVQGVFSIDSDTGSIHLADSQQLSDNSVSIHTLSVLVTDTDGNTFTETVNVDVSETNSDPTFGQPTISLAAHGIDTTISNYGDSVKTADLDNDGDIDFVTSNFSTGEISWHENDGSGSFTQRLIAVDANGITDIAIGDMDDDGHLDIVVTAAQSNQILLYINASETDGSADFSNASKSIWTLNNPGTNANGLRSLQLVDVDQDGRLDIVSASQGSGVIALHLQNDTDDNTFRSTLIDVAAEQAYSVVAADFDGDNDIDIAAGLLVENQIVWYENDGDENFSKTVIVDYAATPNNLVVVVTDIDQDGDADIVTANQTDERIVWLENDGSGNFTEQTLAFVVSSVEAIVVDDFDSDGDKDIVVSSGFDDNIIWLQNEGNQSFRDSEIATSLHVRGMDFGDFDNDGDRDLLATGDTTDKLVWFESDIGVTDLPDATVAFAGGNGAVSLDLTVIVRDAELDSLNGGNGNYAGASLVLNRQGGVSPDDVFGFTDSAEITLVGADLVKNGQIIASFDNVSQAGRLTVTFSDAAGEVPTTSTVNQILSSLTYNNSNPGVEPSIEIAWAFRDGNLRSQGTGGSLEALASTTVTIAASNSAPTVAVNTGATFAEGSQGNVINQTMLLEGDPDDDDDQVTYTITDGLRFGVLTNNGTALTVNGTFTQADIDAGHIQYAHYGSESTSDSFGFTLSDGGEDGSTAAIGTFQLTISSVNDAPTFDSMSSVQVNDSAADATEAHVAQRQADGRLVFAGQSETGSDGDFLVSRINPDGTPDLTFGIAGEVTLDIFGGEDRVVDMIIRPDGKIVLFGDATDGSLSNRFAVVQLNVDGSLDGTFGGGGIWTYEFNPNTEIASANSLALQSDGKLVLGGTLVQSGDSDLVAFRIDSTGTMDNGFGTGGRLDIALTANTDQLLDLEVEDDGTGGSNIVMAGLANGNYGFIARYTDVGVLDTTFSTDGKYIFIYGSATKVTGLGIQADGKYLLTGDLGNGDAGLTRFLHSGALDNSFGSSGYTTVDSGGTETIHRLQILEDGKIILVGSSDVSGTEEAMALRFLENGTVDTGFANNGWLISDIGTDESSAHDIIEGIDGSLYLVGTAASGRNESFVQHLSADGTEDPFFHGTESLGGTAAFVENGTPVVLDAEGSVFDQELSNANDFGDSTLTLSRSTGPDINDVFTATGNLLFDGSDVKLSGSIVGSLVNVDGQLTITFAANTTGTEVNQVIRSIAYSHRSDAPPSTVEITWTFDDQNDSSQGSGNAKQVSGITTVYIVAINDAPVIDLNGPQPGTGYTTSYIENGMPVAIADNDVAVSDLDNASFNRLTVRFSGILNGNQEIVRFAGVDFNATEPKTDFATALGTEVRIVYDGTEFSVTRASGDSLSATNLAWLIQSMTYENSSDNLLEGDRTFQFSVTDSSGLDSVVASSTITTAAVNDTPLVVVPNNSLTAIENQKLVLHGIGFSISDADSAGSSVTTTIEVGEGILNVTAGDSGVVIESGNASASVVLTGTVDAINQLLTGTSSGTVSYLNDSDTPATSTLISVTVNDHGNSGSDPGTTGDANSEVGINEQTIQIMAINDAPFNSGTLPANVVVTEDVKSNIDLSGVQIADVDHANGLLTVTIATARGGSLYATSSGGVVIGGTSSSSLTLTGSLTNLNSYLDTISNIQYLHQTADTAGNNADSVSVAVKDNGNTGFGGGTDQNLGSIRVDITQVNDAPSDINPNSFSVNENVDTSLGQVVGTLTAVDPDAGDSFVFSIDGGADAGNFTINSNNLILNDGLLDHERKDHYTVDVLATDSGGSQYSKTLTVFVADINEAPTDITPHSFSIDENTDTNNGVNVGILTADDPDSGETFTYAIIGGTDQTKFTISGDRLTLDDGILDYENQNSYSVDVQVTDSGGNRHKEKISVNVIDINEAPTDINPNTFSVSENTNTTGGYSVGTLTTTDPDSGETFSYSISGGSDQAKFSISGDQLSLDDGILDHERQATYEVQILVTDGAGNLFRETISVNVDDINETPTDITPDAFNVTELTNTSGGLILGTLTTVDPDSGETFAYTINGGPDQANFSINADQLIFDDGVLNRMRQATYLVDVQVIDGAGHTYSETIYVNVSEVNEAPTAILPSAFNVDENIDTAGGYRVGTLTAADPDSGETFTYSITGGADQAKFSIAGDQLILTDGHLDHERQATYDVQVQVTDSGGNTYSDTLSVDVNDINEAPTAIVPDAFSVIENTDTASGYSVGTLTTIDPDSGDTFAYSISGGSDQAKFSVAGDQLILTDGILDHERQAAYDVQVLVTDGAGNTHSKNIAIAVSDSNEMPTAILPTAFNVDENIDTAGGISVGTLTTVDPDSGEAFVYSIAGGADQAKFSITGDQLILTDGILDHERQPTYNVQVLVTDSAGNTYSEAIDVDVRDINEAPTAILPSTFSVDENTDTSSGFSAGTLTAIDSDSGDTFRYSIAGGVDQAKFSIDGDQLVLTDGILDHERQATYQVQVLVTDSEGNTHSENISVDVSDVNDAPTGITPNQFAVSKTTDTSAGIVLGELITSDPDLIDHFRYEIVGGIDQAEFSLGGAAGATLLFQTPVLDVASQSEYQVLLRTTDAGGLSAEQFITVRIINDNSAPEAVPDSYTTNYGTSITLSSPNPLANDRDAEGDDLFITMVTPPAHGQLSQTPNGEWLYTPSSGFIGEDVWYYRAFDGNQESNLTHVTIRVQAIAGPGSGFASGASSNPGSSLGSRDPGPIGVGNDSESSDNGDRDDSTENSPGNNETPLLINPYAPDNSGRRDHHSGDADAPVGLAESDHDRENGDRTKPLFNRRSELESWETLVDSHAHSGRNLQMSELELAQIRDLLQQDIAQAISWHQWDDYMRQDHADSVSISIGAVGVSAGLASLGYVAWLLRGGAFVTAALSSLPAWRMLDPSTILESYRQSSDDLDSTEQLFNVTPDVKK